MRATIIILLLVIGISGNSQLPTFFFGTMPVKETIPHVPDTVYIDTAQFATSATALSVSGWTDLCPCSSAANHPAAYVKSGTQNGYTLSTNTTAAWNVFGASTANATGGEDTNDGGGFAFNSSVQRSIIYNYNDTYSGNTTDASFKITGLTEDSLYVVELLSTRETGTSRESTAKMIDKVGTTTYTTWMDGTNTGNGNSPTSTGVLATGNTSKFFRMYGKALSGGELYVWIGGTDNATDVKRFGIAAGIRIYKMSIR